ncbi:hypothetical protein A3B18_03420 [Candidatus Giovannonibacteria bacterium RIFCSPLOWO2_01_FULL_46_13]|uniref:Uncharacterized protein n=1 Tax=Candidatus Giovannonibacteria bacterium RIFCSPLOWO2_01_FULL_46_13 TaxID=1798352 RepID=A0A1F5X3X6_9BACT|nr:MAG: hypothetical protein A3B18_03420 [Candidatus Giovannonibacteria bacterium RIFCSPLOWO2_01_FULL_46_13]
MFILLFVFSVIVGFPTYLFIHDLHIWQGMTAICLQGLVLAITTLVEPVPLGLHYREFSTFGKAWLLSILGVAIGAYILSLIPLPEMNIGWPLIILVSINIVMIAWLAQGYLNECQSVNRAIEERRRKGETWIFPWEY